MVARNRFGLNLTCGVLASDGGVVEIVEICKVGRLENFDFLGANGVGIEGVGGFHGGETEHLHEMVLHHVSEGTCGLVVPGAVFDADGLSHGDLDMVDVLTIPERFKDGVGEPEDQKVLHRFFAEVVVDAVDLFFATNLVDDAVEGLGRGEVAAKGFFDDEAGLLAVFQHSGCAELPDGFWKEIRGDGEVEDSVASGVAEGIEFAEEGFEFLVAEGIINVAGAIEESLGKFVPEAFFADPVGKFGDAFAHLIPEVLMAPVATGNADDRGFGGEFAFFAKFVESGDEFALGQVSGGSEEDDDIRFWNALLLQARAQGVLSERRS